MTHNKRLSAPKHYPIERKGVTYVSGIKGSRSPENAVPAVLFLREVANLADTKKEAKKIIRNGDLLRNGEPIKHIKEGIGVLDTIEIPKAEQTFRVLRDGDDLSFIKVDDSQKKIAKIKDKEVVGKEYIYSLHNGENFRTDTEYSTGSTLVFDPEVTEIQLDEGSQVLGIKGKHAGKTSELKEIVEGNINPDTGKTEEFETRLENLVAIGEFEIGDR